MTPNELEKAEEMLMALVVKIRAHGPYSPHAEVELAIVPVLYEIIRHLRQQEQEKNEKNLASRVVKKLKG